MQRVKEEEFEERRRARERVLAARNKRQSISSSMADQVRRQDDVRHAYVHVRVRAYTRVLAARSMRHHMMRDDSEQVHRGKEGLPCLPACSSACVSVFLYADVFMLVRTAYRHFERVLFQTFRTNSFSDILHENYFRHFESELVQTFCTRTNSEIFNENYF